MNDLEKLLKDYPVWSDFEVKMKPRAMFSSYDCVNNLWDVYETSSFTLKLITEAYPSRKTPAGASYLEKWLTSLNDFLNINNKLSNQQIADLNLMLYGRYNHFRLSDLKLLFDYILESRYGNFYGSIDTQRIVTSFFEYNREREETFAKIEERQRAAKKKAENEKPYTPPDLSKYENIYGILKGGEKYIESLAREKSV